MDSYHTIYYRQQLQEMNYDPNYGSAWIVNLESFKLHEPIRLYPTTETTYTSGRIYIALSANKVLTKEDIEKYHILK